VPNTIRIKRSPANTSGAYNPPTLLSGELAFAYRSNTFWIGPTDEASVIQNIRIGGEMNPGTLTANQALVANTSGGINRIFAANVELSRLNANGSWGQPGYVLTSAGSSSNAYWQAVSAIGVNPSSQYTWTNTHIFTNAISFTSNIFATTVNAASYSTGTGYNTADGGAVINATAIALGNGSINGIITTNSTVAYFTGDAYNSYKLANVAAQYYVNTYTMDNTYLPTLATKTSVTDNVARTYTNAVSYTDDRIGTIPGSLRVNTAIFGYTDNAYANAVTFINSKIATANSAMIANAAAAYSNALTNVAAFYVNTQNFSANLVNYAALAGALFTGSINAVSYTTGTGYGTPFGGAVVNSSAISVGNSSVNGAISTNATVAYFTGTAYNANNANNASYLGGQPAANFANTKYVDDALYGATGGSANQSFVIEKAANAYSNAVSYVDGVVLSVNTAITGNAATAYANAVANSANYIDSKILTANAAITGNAVTAYTNAIFYSTILINQAKSDVKADIFANNNTFNGRNTFTANVTFTDEIFVSGVQTIDAPQSNLNILNVSVAGNLTVLGTLTTIDTENVRIEDASIHLASNQASTSTFTDALDISVFGTFGSTTNTWFTGLYRDQLASSSHYTKNVWRLYAANNVNILSTSSNTVDKTSAFYKLGTLTAYLEPYGDTGTFVVNSSVVSINSASGTSVRITANTLSLVTPLAAISGGTGLSLYNTGDILYASSSTTLAKKTIGSAGKVLQVSSSNLPEWDNLDGGTF
jgi:hypothetical protein